MQYLIWSESFGHSNRFGVAKLLPERAASLLLLLQRNYTRLPKPHQTAQIDLWGYPCRTDTRALFKP
jgi:hypothetical protein